MSRPPPSAEQRSGRFRSSMYMPAAPSCSTSCTVRRTFRGSPKPSSQSTMTGTEVARMARRAASSISVCVMFPESGLPMSDHEVIEPKSVSSSNPSCSATMALKASQMPRLTMGPGLDSISLSCLACSFNFAPSADCARGQAIVAVSQRALSTSCARLRHSPICVSGFQRWPPEGWCRCGRLEMASSRMSMPSPGFAGNST